PFASRRFHLMWKSRIARDHTLGTLNRTAAVSSVKPALHVKPGRCGPGSAAHVAHRRAGKISDPHADREAVRVTDAPVVAHVLAGSCLRRAPERSRQRVLETEGRTAARAIGQDVRDHK